VIKRKPLSENYRLWSCGCVRIVLGRTLKFFLLFLLCSRCLFFVNWTMANFLNYIVYILFILKFYIQYINLNKSLLDQYSNLFMIFVIGYVTVGASGMDRYCEDCKV
jgi:hypothetical protein